MLLISLAALLVRVLVSISPYSGQGVTPNSTTTRRSGAGWSSPSTSLPPTESPHALLNTSLPDAVALLSSHDFESTETKLLMRWIVLSSNLVVFFPATLWLV
ncbi:hypothetical protein ABZP36_006458 [Zizania latifolia]